MLIHTRSPIANALQIKHLKFLPYSSDCHVLPHLQVLVFCNSLSRLV
uniref:Uncharacterized protein n=1 Tax=Nelumbo nucifera TaxID=4432 RepID=A0A822XA00_NELNU|nr:TPA_asm: hypothetical protein HUJ06_019747 [Nelumbo nucifera]